MSGSPREEVEVGLTSVGAGFTLGSSGAAGASLPLSLSASGARVPGGARVAQSGPDLPRETHGQTVGESADEDELFRSKPG